MMLSIAMTETLQLFKQKRMTTDPYSIGSNAYDFLIEPFLARIKLLTVSIILKRFNKSRDVRILEVACGTGTLSHLLAKKGFNVLALDNSYSMIRQTYNKIHDSSSSRVTAIHGDASTMPFYSESFDAVIMQLGLHEMENKIRMNSGREIIRVAKKDAVFVLFDFAPTNKWSYSKFILTIIEFIAGTDHYRNGRRFIKDGGILSFL
ncbi:MAG: class I SAM-dependent methyltransferase [Deltaproteobacteria bacterium]|nr:class I SAM-dependent methyltransferase [Deltaproteobacteria bacterium]